MLSSVVADADTSRDRDTRRRALIRLGLIALPALAVLLAPAPADLPVRAQRVLAVVVLAIGLWSTEVMPAGVTGVVVIVALILTGAVPNVRDGFVGFADPVPYFLVGVLTIGLAVAKSGLAERIAVLLIARAGGRPRRLYVELLASFPLMTLLLPSATTRTGILVHVYDQALELAAVPRGAPLAKAIMLALNSINRLASTLLLTGGITPVVAAALIGNMSWGRWFWLMLAPYGALLAIGAALIYWQYRAGFRGEIPLVTQGARAPLSPREIRTLLIVGGAAALWLTDALHHWHPVIPALIAWICLLAPGIGVITWNDFEQGFGWANLFVIASSLSLARALISSEASTWVATHLARDVPALAGSPLLVVVALLAVAALLRALIPNITGFLATTIPLAMSVGTATGVNPLVCGLAVTIAGDAVLYYPAQSASSLVVYQRGHLTAPEIFRFGVWMTLLAALVVVAVALPYWVAIGVPLR
jgi:solute carrier family 13 (sodium-dependent dicarboxylate transporter), member 2/3/5